MIVLALFENSLALEEVVNNLVRQEALGQFRVISHTPSKGLEPKLVLPGSSISAGVDPLSENRETSALAQTSLQELESQLSNHFSAPQLHHVMAQIEEGRPALLLRVKQTERMTELLKEVGATEVITGG